jgi:predicted amidohydrolase
MRELARRFGVTIITGGFFEKLPEGTYVTAPVVDPQGRILGRQKKIHLFGSERSRAKPGFDCEVFSVQHVNFGVMICYDAAFPEVARVFALKGADIVFVPSRISAVGIQPWHLYLSARCLENRLPMVAPNVVQPPRYVGHSIILDLKSEPESLVVYPNLFVGGESPDVLLSDIDLTFARRLRISRLRERRPETYGLIAKPLEPGELQRYRIE